MKFSISDDLEFDALPITFYFNTFSGVWCPRDWKPFSKLMYGFWSVYQGMVGFLFWSSVIMNTIVRNKNSENFFENIFAVSSLSFALYKQFFVSRRRKLIENLVRLCFKNTWFDPRDKYEIKAIEDCKSEARFAAVIYAFGICIGLFVKALRPILKSNREWAFPVEAWFPFDTRNLKNYYLSYFFELIGGVPLICLHISVDCFYVGLVLQMCASLKILNHRLRDFVSSTDDNTGIDEKQMNNKLSIYAHEHATLFKIVKRMNSEFRGIMIGQIMATIPNICINVYSLSIHKNGINFRLIDSFICLATCLMQIFLYCWYGNKIILQSINVTDAIYGMDWILLTSTMKKKLITMMLRATRPMRFFTGSFIMNIDSFIAITRMSYSAFRLLQRASK